MRKPKAPKVKASKPKPETWESKGLVFWCGKCGGVVTHATAELKCDDGHDVVIRKKWLSSEGRVEIRSQTK